MRYGPKSGDRNYELADVIFPRFETDKAAGNARHTGPQEKQRPADDWDQWQEFLNDAVVPLDREQIAETADSDR